jgi:branched-chain amino acid transport system substrate-binding protein
LEIGIELFALNWYRENVILIIKILVLVLGDSRLSNYKAITRIQSIILVAVIVFVAVGGGATYVMLSGDGGSSEPIKIGLGSRLDMQLGKDSWQGAVLAAEELNTEGGILGRQVEIIVESAEDVGNMQDVISAMTRLITFHGVDFMIGGWSFDMTNMIMDIAADHKTIFFALTSSDESNERVQEDYDRYKYYFRAGVSNHTFVLMNLIDGLVTLRDYTGFNKVGYLNPTGGFSGNEWTEGLDYYLPENGFDLVYRGLFPYGTVDFTSYFALAEEAGTEIMIGIFGDSGIPIIKEWHDRQAPMVIWGVNVFSQLDGFWNWTDGKCLSETVIGTPYLIEYPLTSKTLPARNAYIDRWGTTPTYASRNVYEIIRYVLPAAIEHAGTIETEAVVKALEEIEVETASQKGFRYTSDHDKLFYSGDFKFLFTQWQANGERVIVYPEEIMNEIGATYQYPPWPGPWD